MIPIREGAVTRGWFAWNGLRSRGRKSGIFEGKPEEGSREADGPVAQIAFPSIPVPAPSVWEGGITGTITAVPFSSLTGRIWIFC